MQGEQLNSFHSVTILFGRKLCKNAVPAYFGGAFIVQKRKPKLFSWSLVKYRDFPGIVRIITSQQFVKNWRMKKARREEQYGQIFKEV